MTDEKRIDLIPVLLRPRRAFDKPGEPFQRFEAENVLTFARHAEKHPELYCGDYLRDPGQMVTATRTVEAGRWCIEDPYFGPSLVYRSRRPGGLERWFARWLLVGWTWQDRAEYTHG